MKRPHRQARPVKGSGWRSLRRRITRNKCDVTRSDTRLNNWLLACFSTSEDALCCQPRLTAPGFNLFWLPRPWSSTTCQSVPGGCLETCTRNVKCGLRRRSEEWGVWLSTHMGHKHGCNPGMALLGPSANSLPNWPNRLLGSSVWRSLTPIRQASLAWMQFP